MVKLSKSNYDESMLDTSGFRERLAANEKVLPKCRK